MTRDEINTVAKLIKRMAVQLEQERAAHKTALAEMRSSFVARTGADEKIIEGLRAEIDSLKRGRWSAKGCEPCDPPTEATHDTPEGRSVAESVIRDGRKTEPKPGDTVRLVRIPSRDVVSLELQTVLEWPWIERWGTLNQIAMVVEPRYQLDGAVAVCLSTNVHARWPINCLEVVAAATHDTEAGNAAAGAALKTEPVAEEIKVGDLVEVVSNTGRNTWLADVGSVGTVVTVEEINDSISVCLDDVPGKKNALAGYVSICDVRKVTT